MPPDLLSCHLVVFTDGGNQVLTFPTEREVIKPPLDHFSVSGLERLSCPWGPHQNPMDSRVPRVQALWPEGPSEQRGPWELEIKLAPETCCCKGPPTTWRKAPEAAPEQRTWLGRGWGDGARDSG